MGPSGNAPDRVAPGWNPPLFLCFLFFRFVLSRLHLVRMLTLASYFSSMMTPTQCLYHTHPAGIISRRVRVVEPCVVRRLCHGGAACCTPAVVCVLARLFFRKNQNQSFVSNTPVQFDRHGSLFPFPSWLERWLGLLVPLQSVEIVGEKSVGSVTVGRGFVNRLVHSVERH